MARFFIDRPVFAWVISLFILLGGLLSIDSLPVSQYPAVAPPVVSVRATYPGASARVVEESVTAVIEREMNGIPGLLYSSSSSSAGSGSLTLTFRQGVNADLAAIEVQNRLKRIEPRLPEAVRRYGLSAEKASENFALIVTLTSDDQRLQEIDLGELASATVVQALRRVEGVGDIQFWGAEYAMRIWPNPVKMATLGVTAADITSVVSTHNSRVTVGDIGNEGVPDSAPISASILEDSALQTPEEFGAIVLRTRPDGSALHLRDVARIELGANDLSSMSRVNGKPAAGLGVRLAPGANALATTQRVKDAMAAISRAFPTGVSYQFTNETASFVELSIRKVLITLVEAVVLVFIVMFLFMQNLRATLIPTLVVPVALAGTLCLMLPLGFSINVLTLFGMVLAIGILVDDAIVVVENVERILMEEQLSPYDATVKAMRQISGAIVGVTVVLVSVFVPMAFYSGAIGNIYRQFAFSLAVSIAFSAFLALSLTPALCATLLKPADHQSLHEKPFFRWFNAWVRRCIVRYQGMVGAILRRPKGNFAVYAVLLLLAVLLFVRLPSAFIPDEDQGELMVMVTLPAGATHTETLRALKEINEYLIEQEPVSHTYALSGFNFDGGGSNAGMVFVSLADWTVRKRADQHIDRIAERITIRFADRPNMRVSAFGGSALPELGSTRGFDLQLLDVRGVGTEALAAAREQLLAAANNHPKLSSVTYAGPADAPQLRLSFDRNKASVMGVSINEVTDTLATMFGSNYVGDFIYRNQVRQVIVQADGEHRVRPDDLRDLHVRNLQGEMVPLAAFADLQWTTGTRRLARYNGSPSFNINGEAAAGTSTGEAISIMEKLLARLPEGIGFAWTGQTLEERVSGQQAPVLFGLSVLVVFLALAALYESWAIPLAVIMVVPLGVIGALLGVTLRGLPNDIYFKVGLIATIGLSAKNAILIVEIAKELYSEGRSLTDATLEACRLRLRPIVMTSLAFGVGVLPLVVATGPGSGAQIAIGTGVFGGILSGTALSIFLVPLFFVTVYSFVSKRAARQQQ